jgi:zinc transport system permease protein
MDLLDYDFMRRALLAAVLVGLTAPAVGVFLVQRRLTLVGDGLGHTAVAGVALGLVLDRSPIGFALLAAVGASIVIELLRAKAGTAGEIALAIVFYGGIAAGVVLVSRAPGGSRSLNAYLFGAITTTSAGDLVVFAVLAAVILALVIMLGRPLFSVSNDEDYARATGLPVVPLNLLLAILTALTVVVSMRIVGVLLISALMVVPVATAQVFSRSFRVVRIGAIVTGVVVSVAGVVLSYETDTPSGGTIVVLAIVVFLAATSFAFLTRRRSHSF